MKVVVTLWCGGRTFDEEVIVARLEDADATALARNPSNGVKLLAEGLWLVNKGTPQTFLQ